jgi:hypothetical protein
MKGRVTVTLKLWLIVWGVAAFIALAAPGIVAVAMFLIVPGLILIAAPTIFLYSAMFAVFRRLLVMSSGLKRDVIAGLCSLLLGWTLALPGAVVGRTAFARANLPEVKPASPVKLAGNVRVELPKFSSIKHDFTESCSALCAALLDTPDVQSVTVAESGQSANTAPLVFRLASRDGNRSQSAFPVSPESILDDLPRGPAPKKIQDIEAHLAQIKLDKQAVAASWGLRLTSSQKLVVERGWTPADQTIRVTNFRGNGPTISRVEVLGRDGRALMRRSIVVGRSLSAPLRFAGTGGIENYHVELSRDRLTSGPEDPPLNPVTELFRYSSLAKPKVDQGLTNAMLDRLRAATSNPALQPDDPDFGLADMWLPTIDWQHPLPGEQLSVLRRVIADERIPISPKLYSGYESKVAPELRTVLGSRIISPSTSSQARAQLARLLARMPEGTFARLSADERTILASEQLRSDVCPMIVRLADRGEAAIPELLTILERDRTLQPEYRRKPVMHAVALSFATLGPRAHSALAEVEGLINVERPRPIRSSDERVWDLALARMGKPIDEFNWPGHKPEYVARERESLRRQVEHFDPKRVWTY